MNDKNNMIEIRRKQDKVNLMQSFNNLFSSFKYMFQSAAGKSSIEFYLETISEFTDDTIREAGKEGLEYIGGECSIKLNPQNSEQILATIEMQFHTVDGDWKSKQAKRMLEKNRFTDEVIRQIGEGKGLRFAINPPEKG
ncbi:hypothetical protein KPL47_18870 [Clostridium estertheticum]|uniref:hypothetical protein n=1 Tax=Clostridium estertheticum TaxID=238834 RepID=UPI001C0CF657|nr:hypothetical protein [Clostridium estertheticum]MBU3178391.1 hypothetical protein [Clostridium estertheticum]